MLLSEAIQEFLIAIEADGVSLNTLTWYRSILKTFNEWMKDRTLESISTKDIRLYIIHLQKDYKPDTIHAHKRVQHKFWSWCEREYNISNPMRNIKYPSPPKQHTPKAANIADISRLFEAMDQNSYLGKRDAAILAFLADTGCRSGGLCSLTMERLNMDERSAIVIEKGRATRTVHFTPFTRDKLLPWLAIRPQVESVFCNLRTLKPLTTNGVYQIFTRYKKQLGIMGRTNPHSYRHAFAREYLKSGGDLKTLSQILGHASIEVTADIYSIFLPSELKDKHNKHTPINKISESLDKDNGGV